jgi:hypothetical protein
MDKESVHRIWMFAGMQIKVEDKWVFRRRNGVGYDRVE